jgi:hypothetical protein
MHTSDNDQMINDCAEALVACREFCGNELQAMRDWEADNGRLSVVARAIVIQRADKIWAGYQKEAGVTAPISSDERASIDRMFARAP